MDRSKSLEMHRRRRSHPKLRSTTQRRDMTTTPPLGVPGFSDDLHSDRAIRFLERACQLVAAIGAGNKGRVPSRSWICAGWTWAASVLPSMSTAR